MTKDERLRRSQSQEKRIAQLVGGTQNLGSGNLWQRKNDVRGQGTLVECKRTDKKQITLKLSDLEGLRKNARLEDRLPVLHIEIGNRRWVLLEEGDYLGLIDGD